MKKALTILAAAAMIAVSASPAYAYGIDCRPNVKCVGDAKGNVMFGSGGQDIMRGLGGADSMDGDLGNDRMYGVTGPTAAVPKGTCSEDLATTS